MSSVHTLIQSTYGREFCSAVLDLLCLRYCDKGNPNYFNWREFAQNCDPADEDLQKAEAENLAPYQVKRSSKYFTRAGEVYDANENAGA